MIDDAILAQALEDVDGLPAQEWSELIGELRRDPQARARLRALQRQDDGLARLLRDPPPAIRRMRRRRPVRRSVPWAMVSGIAAVVAMTVGLWSYRTLPADPGIILVQAGAERPVSVGDQLAPGVPAALRWPDGTVVSLSASAAVRIAAPGRIRLDAGSCGAEVAHRADAPFVIATGRAEVAVLGTAFTVSLDGDATEVRVRRGLVRVSAAAGGEVDVGPSAMTRVGSSGSPERPRRCWPEFDASEVVARRGGLVTPNATLATGPDGPELAAAFQYPERGITGVRLVPAEPVHAVAGMRLHLRYRVLAAVTDMTVQCMNEPQAQNFIARLPDPPADGSWCTAVVELSAFEPVLHPGPWRAGETVGNVLLSSENAQVRADVIRLGDFSFSAPAP